MGASGSRFLGATTLGVAALALFAGSIPAHATGSPESRRSFDARGEGLGPYTRSLSSPTGYLTGPQEGEPLVVARAYAADHAAALGVTADDLVDTEVTDAVYSTVSGATRVYLRQRHRGIPVYNGQLQVNVNRDGRVISVHSALVPGLAAAATDATPALDAEAALLAAAGHLGLSADGPPRKLAPPSGVRRSHRLRAPGISTDAAEAALAWLPVGDGEARLVWTLLVRPPGGGHLYELTVDAVDGRVWTRFDRTDADSYRVYPRPVESPDHTSPAPPADARVLVTDPAHPVASPLGWHDTGSASYTVTHGNNTHAFEECTGLPIPCSEPQCGPSLVCDFPLDLTQGATSNVDAAVTQLFYWVNLVHDVIHRYGFDEPAGNFQIDNFGRGGVGGDDIRAEGLDGNVNNAFFTTSPEGQQSAMEIGFFLYTSPSRAGELDAGLLVHEYGHGISNRLIGGPSTVTCLENDQQPGEGWSDFYALAFTAEPGDQGADPRPLVTYPLGDPPTGPGARTQLYSTDPAVNTHTYESIDGMGIPHGVGEVWAQALWEVYWALIGAHGYDPDLYDATGGAGNQRAILYVTEGLKNTACSPTFTDARDGIVQAATDLHGGADVCLVWQAFAAFGLGIDAVSGGPGSTSPTNGFAVPGGCAGGNTPPAVTITAPASGSTVDEGDPVTFVASATDAEDGDLTGSIAWSSSLDGALGGGGSVTTSSLSAGAHTVTAAVTDSGGLGGSDAIGVTVVGACPDGDSDGFLDDACGGTDCDDANAGINPGALELCANAVDDDCNGLVDCADGSCSGDPACPSCLPQGTSCTSNSQCCSNKCRGRSGSKKCK